jgi:pimeloyl-ACP methyl ester carboxylesterase
VLRRWPVPCEHLRIPTHEGETFVVASGRKDAPPLLLFHGSGTNSAIWMDDIASWAEHFRVDAVDVIGERVWHAVAFMPRHYRSGSGIVPEPGAVHRRQARSSSAAPKETSKRSHQMLMLV